MGERSFPHESYIRIYPSAYRDERIVLSGYNLWLVQFFYSFDGILRNDVWSHCYPFTLSFFGYEKNSRFHSNIVRKLIYQAS